MSERYEIVAQIGDGGTSTVYRAMDTHLMREVAIKVIKADHKAVAASLNEALALSALNHPNIVTVYDVGQDTDGSQFIVMELIGGETLEETVKRAVLPAEDLHAVATQVLSGLSAAHSAGYLHRDIKPSNLMLSWPAGGGYLTKILDFGLAKRSAAPTEQTVDHSGSILGSIYYMAPEQFERGRLDARTDLYQFGCTLYFAATGISPANGETSAQVMAAHLVSRFEPLANLRPDLPVALVDWINRLMSRSPEDRPQDASAALQLLTDSKRSAHTVLPARRGNTAIPVQTIPVPAQKTPLLKERGGFRVGYIAASVLFLAVLIITLSRRHAANSEEAVIEEPARLRQQSESSTAAPEPAQPMAQSNRQERMAPAPRIDPTDLAAIRANIGNPVTVEGTVIRVGESRSGRTRYINISSSREHLAIAIDVRSVDDLYPMSTLESYIGKKATATGRLREVYGSPLLYIERAGQLTISE